MIFGLSPGLSHKHIQGFHDIDHAGTMLDLFGVLSGIKISHYYIKSSILYEQSKKFGFRSQYFHLNQCSRNPSVIFDILNSLTGKMMMLPELQSERDYWMSPGCSVL